MLPNAPVYNTQIVTHRQTSRKYAFRNAAITFIQGHFLSICDENSMKEEEGNHAADVGVGSATYLPLPLAKRS